MEELLDRAVTSEAQRDIAERQLTDAQAEIEQLHTTNTQVL